ncbi:hypothetical protein [Streptomyces noursei]|uniref:hypothetical protein n=1 Tax=Streptomyces noursei TaxID=1971 RepID=UPI00167874F1|nr:hypothetical protein [Streptomyces noursei]MCZ1014825.1 hypothetical protein [Streptomyces noursei]GGX48230.1 hypothetical protein GCM10010341_82360 [Streptomyces noursei]
MSLGMLPVAFAHDRCVVRCRRYLDMRLAGCRSYAERQGRTVAGQWLDFTAIALGTRRPRLTVLLDTMYEVTANEGALLCLVHSAERLPTDPGHRLVLLRRIAEAAGRIVTTFGGSGRPVLPVRVRMPRCP